MRRGLGAFEVEARSAATIARVRELPPFASAATILCYVASKDNEVNTQPLIETLLAEGRTVLVPIAGKDRILNWSRIESMHELAPARFGILEPRPEFLRITNPPDDSVAIVPGIAFQPDGYRIGYGGGFYDRFLAHYAGVSIGLAFDVQIVESFPIEAHDVPLHYIVTESQAYDAAKHRAR